MRPNAVPSKICGYMTNKESAAEHVSNFISGRRRPRMMMKDNCDFCLKIAWFYRRQIGLRKLGRKFMCEICRFKNNKQEEAIKEKYLPCWQVFHTMKADKNN